MKQSEKMQEVAYGWDEQARSGTQSPILHAAATRMRWEAKRVAALEARLSKMEEYARHKKECQIARAWGLGPGGTFTDPHCNCGYEKALSATEALAGERR